MKRVVQSFLDKMIEELGHGNRLEFRDFGVFEIKDRAPRLAQNPKTLERVPVPAKRTVKFKVGRLLKEHRDIAPHANGTSAPKVLIKPEVVVRQDVAENGRVPARKTADR